jgi:GNAT superfamily N-acetyltransferase
MLQVRELGPDDWSDWRSIRLTALAESPDAFTTKLSDWQGERDIEPRWRERLASVPYNIVAEHDGRAVGMVSAMRSDANGPVELLSLWVTPDVRGTGVGDALVSSVIDWARAHSARSLRLRVIEGNGPAERLYVRHGLRRSSGGDPGAEGTEIEMERSL